MIRFICVLENLKHAHVIRFIWKINMICFSKFWSFDAIVPTQGHFPGVLSERRRGVHGIQEEVKLWKTGGCNGYDVWWLRPPTNPRNPGRSLKKWIWFFCLLRNFNKIEPPFSRHFLNEKCIIKKARFIMKKARWFKTSGKRTDSKHNG